MTGKDPYCEPEESRLRAELDLTGIESPRPRLAVGLTFETPVREDSPLTAIASEPLALVQEAVRQFNSHRDRDRNRIEPGKRLVREQKPTGASHAPRPQKHGRGRLLL